MRAFIYLTIFVSCALAAPIQVSRSSGLERRTGSKYETGDVVNTKLSNVSNLETKARTQLPPISQLLHLG